MRITCILLLAAFGATGQWRASGVVVPPMSNRVALTWGSLGPGTQYYVQTSTNLLTWTTATNTTATNVSLAFVGGQARMFRLSVSNAPTRSITLAWDASVPATNVAGYTIYYGVSPGSYTDQVEVGLTTTGVVSNLVAGTTYYFVVTAYSPAGLESDYSSEVVWQGQNSPRLMIQQLP
jgi:Fibronectin type III domain